MSSEPGVEKEVSLNLISDSDLRREADKIRQAKKLKKEAEKLTPIGTPDRGGTDAALPRSTTGPLDRKSAVSGGRTVNAFQEMQKKLRDAEKAAKDAEKAAKKAEKTIEKKTKELDDKIENVIDRGGDFIKNPTSAISGELTGLLSKAGPAGLAAALALQLKDEILKEFEDGGAFDTRVKEIQQASVLGPIEYLTDINAGVVLFSQSGYLSDEPPSISNTEKLVAGQMRYFLFNSGDYVGVING